jgi:hypothetical protein
MEAKVLTRDLKLKIITVIDKDDRVLASCSIKRATKLVNRNCAIWSGDNIIKLLINNNDRKQLRKEIVEEAGRICYICGVYITKDQYPTLDHILPKSNLGKDVKENLQCCCKRCNDDKADLYITDYVKYIKDNRLEYPWITGERIHELEIFIAKLSI